MQTRFKDGSVMVVGGCAKDAELEYVGDNGKRVCKLGLAVGKRADGSTVWVNVQAWHDVASVLATARKGAQVLVVGQLREHEYNGKTYTDLVADFVSVCAPATSVPIHARTEVVESEQFKELDDDGIEFPF